MRVRRRRRCRRQMILRRCLTDFRLQRHQPLTFSPSMPAASAIRARNGMFAAAPAKRPSFDVAAPDAYRRRCRQRAAVASMRQRYQRQVVAERGRAQMFADNMTRRRHLS